MEMTRCSAARLAHLSGGQGVASSNLAISTDGVLTKESLKELFDKIGKEEIVTQKMFISSGTLGSIWGADIHVNTAPEILTEEEKLERRILAKGW